MSEMMRKALERAREKIEQLNKLTGNESLGCLVEIDAALSATPAKEREDLGDRSFAASIEAQALRSIAEGNLGDGPGQANYERIKSVALSALSKARSAGPSKDERDAVIEELVSSFDNFWAFVQGEYGVKISAEDQEDHNVCKFFEALSNLRALKHSPKAGQEDE